MKNLSLFDHALSQGSRTDELGQLASIARKDFEEHESFTCRTTTASVEYACLLIENAVLLRTNRGGRVYAGFEKLSQLQPIIDRYLRMADVSEAVYLFGEQDWTPPRHPNIRVVSLRPDSRLAREWFVIADSPTFHTAFLAFDEEGEDKSMPEQIRYWALKTSNKRDVMGLVNAVDVLIDQSLAA